MEYEDNFIFGFSDGMVSMARVLQFVFLSVFTPHNSLCESVSSLHLQPVPPPFSIIFSDPRSETRRLDILNRTGRKEAAAQPNGTRQHIWSTGADDRLLAGPFQHHPADGPLRRARNGPLSRDAIQELAPASGTPAVPLSFGTGELRQGSRIAPEHQHLCVA